MSKQFIYQFTPARPDLRPDDPTAWTEEDNRIAARHFAYLQQATEAGTVILAGRDPTGKGPAIVIIEVESEQAARDFMNDDPFVARGLMHADLHPFRVALLRA